MHPDRKPRRDDEDRLQMAIWSHILIRGTKDTIAYCVPNGGPRSKASAGRLKAMGVLPGVADLMFILNDGSAAAMELKIPGGVQSPAQKDFEARCHKIGAPYVICSDLDNALSILEAWGVLKPARNLK